MKRFWEGSRVGRSRGAGRVVMGPLRESDDFWGGEGGGALFRDVEEDVACRS